MSPAHTPSTCQIGRVAGGAIAEKWLTRDYGIEIVAWVSSVGKEELSPDAVDLNTITREEVGTVPS